MLRRKWVKICRSNLEKGVSQERASLEAQLRESECRKLRAGESSLVALREMLMVIIDYRPESVSKVYSRFFGMCLRLDIDQDNVASNQYVVLMFGLLYRRKLNPSQLGLTSGPGSLKPVVRVKPGRLSITRAFSCTAAWRSGR